METIYSPLGGELVPLEQVEDEAFSQKMMGEGIAILPTEGVLRAPADGVVDTVADTRHAVGIRTSWGADILVHVGQDTVGLKGRGFKALVAEGQAVKRGDILLEFDLDAIREAGLNPTTPVTVVNASDYASVAPAAGSGTVKAGEPIIQVSRRS